MSWGSLNQLDTGTALFGWKMYDAGELSRMMVSSIGRPSWDRSYISLGSDWEVQLTKMNRTRLDVVATVVVAALTEQAMGDDTVNVELVKHGISVLQRAGFVRRSIHSRQAKIERVSAHFAQAGGEDHDLVDLAHFLEEGVDAWTFDDVDVVPVIFDLDGNHVVRLLD